MAETRSTRLKYVKRKRICFQYLKKIIANTELFVVKTEISSSKNPNLLISGAPNKRVQKPFILLWQNLTFAKLFFFYFR